MGFKRKLSVHIFFLYYLFFIDFNLYLLSLPFPLVIYSCNVKFLLVFLISEKYNIGKHGDCCCQIRLLVWALVIRGAAAAGK